MPFVIGYSDYFGFGFTNSVENRCTCNAVSVVCYIYDVCNSVFVLRSHLGGKVRALPLHASVYNVFS